MTKNFWLNLPVKNLDKSKAFFTALGFIINADSPGNSSTSAPLLVGSTGMVVMLFEESLFTGFTRNALTDTAGSTEVLMSIDAESRGEVDEMARKAAAAGGTVFSQPAESQGWMYGCAFTDLDGHRWNVLYMDTSKINQ